MWSLFDACGMGEVGDGPGDLDEAEVAPGGKPHARDGAIDKISRGGFEDEEFRTASLESSAFVANPVPFESGVLAFSCGLRTCARSWTPRRRHLRQSSMAGTFGASIRGRCGRGAVPIAVADSAPRRAVGRAGTVRIRREAARARIHRADKREACRKETVPTARETVTYPSSSGCRRCSGLAVGIPASRPERARRGARARSRQAGDSARRPRRDARGGMVRGAKRTRREHGRRSAGGRRRSVSGSTQSPRLA